MREQERGDVIVDRERSPWSIVGAIIAVLLIIFLFWAFFTWWGNRDATEVTPVVAPAASTSSTPSASPSPSATPSSSASPSTSPSTEP